MADARRPRARDRPLVFRRGFLHTGRVVTLRTWAFAIGFHHSSTPIAQALICPDARYIAVRWQDGRFDRRHVPASLWTGLEQELARELARAVSPSSLISTVLVGSLGALMRVAFLEVQAVDVSRMEDAERVLDAATHVGQPAARRGGLRPRGAPLTSSLWGPRGPAPFARATVASLGRETFVGNIVGAGEVR